MDNPALGYPFTQRKMLAFEQGVAFSLRIVSHSAYTSPIVIRGMTREGIFNFKHVPDGTGTPFAETFRIPDLPIWVSVSDDDQNYVQGQIRVFLSVLANGDTLYGLGAGMVYWPKVLSWPATDNADTMPWSGRIAEVFSADPAAGAEISITVPTGQLWEILHGSGSLVTDGTVANRRPHFVFTSGSGTKYDFFGNTDQAASLTRKYTVANFGSGLSEADDNDILVPIPGNIWLDAGGTIITETTNFKAGDNWGSFHFRYRQYFMSA